MSRKIATRRRGARRRVSLERHARLVFEIGTEELPPEAAWQGARQFPEAATLALRKARITCGAIAAYSTPRRIVLVVDRVVPRQGDLVQEIRGPASRLAFAADGSPTRAAEGFARAQGVPTSALERRQTPQGDYVFARLRSPGGPTLQVLADVLPVLASGLIFPKSMRWGPDETRFARPVRWVLALLGHQIVPCAFAGVPAGRTTYGHRILSPGRIVLKDAREYETAMTRHWVLLDPSERRRRVAALASRAARRAGGRPILDPSLLAETVQLVEWPEAFSGAFAPEFLTLPREVLITVMQHHQKYFAVEDAAGQLLPAFVALRNGGTRGLRTVREGNEWVLRARLADAQFFFNEDRKAPLVARVPALADLIVHEKLGTMKAKTDRLVQLAPHVGRLLGLGEEKTRQLQQAALLSKADLVTQMVRELPELQGVMGGLYAHLDGEPAAVAEALREQYLPRGPLSPRSDIGSALALLDKLDTLVSAVHAGFEASGSEDPYGLRRAAQGIVTIVLDRNLRLPIAALIREILGMLPWQPELLTLDTPVAQALAPVHSAEAAAELHRTNVVAGVMTLLVQRLRMSLIDSGISYDTVDAVLASGADDLADAAMRARALWEFRRDPAFGRLYTAFDRAARILPPVFDGRVSPDALATPAERRLHSDLETLRPQVEALVVERRYDEALLRLAAIADPVDQLFTDVLVMAEDEAVRTNRLALLAAVVGLVRPIADLARVVAGEGKTSGTS
jgi:glycyl-tRNA synthetase beta chain